MNAIRLFLLEMILNGSSQSEAFIATWIHESSYSIEACPWVYLRMTSEVMDTLFVPMKQLLLARFCTSLGFGYLSICTCFIGEAVLVHNSNLLAKRTRVLTLYVLLFLRQKLAFRLLSSRGSAT